MSEEIKNDFTSESIVCALKLESAIPQTSKTKSGYQSIHCDELRSEDVLLCKDEKGNEFEVIYCVPVEYQETYSDVFVREYKCIVQNSYVNSDGSFGYPSDVNNLTILPSDCADHSNYSRFIAC